jgi:hypothetical protein
MSNVEFLSNTHPAGVEEVAVIYNEDGSYTSMPKVEYDRRQAEAEQSTPSVTNGD